MLASSSLVMRMALLVGVLLRLLALGLHPPLDVDETRYLVTAHHLSHGDGYTDWHGPEIDILPLHPSLTALMGQSSETLEARGRSVACAASILGLFLLAWLARRLAGEATAVVATWLVAIHPWVLREANRPAPESLYVMCVIAAALALAPLIQGVERPLLGLLSGAFFGLAYLARPEGFLIGLAFLAYAVWRLRRTPGIAGILIVAFLSSLLIVSGPYLIWLRQVVGGWTLTGKSAEVFFIGQAAHASKGQGTSAAAYLSMQAQYRSVIRFVIAHPLDVAARAGRFAVTLFAWILPRALGPLGLVGLGFACSMRKRRGEDAPIAWWILLPGLVLPLMMFTFPMEQVAGATIPFFLIVAAAGLMRAWRSLTERWPGGGSVVLAGALVLAVVPWIPSVIRGLDRGSLVPDDPDREAVMRAISMEPSAGEIVTNSPVVSFYLRDPALLGPPGRYAPLEPDQDCESLAREMKRRGSDVAVVEFPTVDPGVIAGGTTCPVVLLASITERGTPRRFEVLKLKE